MLTDLAVNADRLVAGALDLDGCWSDDEVSLVGAAVERIGLRGARMPTTREVALRADGIHVAHACCSGPGTGRAARRRSAPRARSGSSAPVRTLSFIGERLAWNANCGWAQATAFMLTICGWLLTSALIAGLAMRRQ